MMLQSEVTLKAELNEAVCLITLRSRHSQNVAASDPLENAYCFHARVRSIADFLQGQSVEALQVQSCSYLRQHSR